MSEYKIVSKKKLEKVVDRLVTAEEAVAAFVPDRQLIATTLRNYNTEQSLRISYENRFNQLMNIVKNFEYGGLTKDSAFEQLVKVLNSWKKKQNKESV